jgi:hypothetical protein
VIVRVNVALNLAPLISELATAVDTDPGPEGAQECGDDDVVGLLAEAGAANCISNVTKAAALTMREGCLNIFIVYPPWGLPHFADVTELSDYSSDKSRRVWRIFARYELVSITPLGSVRKIRHRFFFNAS